MSAPDQTPAGASPQADSPSVAPPAERRRQFWRDFRKGRWRRDHFRLIIIAILGLAVFLLLFRFVRELPTEAFVDELRDWGVVPFFIGFTFLPLVGFPTTPFYLVAGAAFGTLPSIVGVSLGLAAQLSLAYWLARRFLRGWIEWLVRRGGYSIPEVRPAHHFRMALIVKLAPGPPTFMKSYLLGLAGISFPVYMIVSWTTSVAYAVSFVILGESIIDGDPRKAVLGLAILALTAGIMIYLRERFDPARRARKQ